MNQLRIQKPCSENWSDMSATECGAFCQKCSKEVIDFTNKSNDHIRTILLQHSGSEVCGRITSTQLDQLNMDFELWNNSEKWNRNHLMFYSFLLVLGLSLASCTNQKDQKEVENIRLTLDHLIHNSETENSDNIKISPPEKEINVQPIQKIEIETDSSAVIFSYPPKSDSSEKIADSDLREQFYTTHDITVLGGMSFSTVYNTYLEEVVPEQKQNQLGNPIPVAYNALVFPNPTSGRTTLKFDVPDSTKVSFALYSMAGEQISILEQKPFEPGFYEIPFDLTDQPSGTYLIMLLSENFRKSVKVVKL